MRTIDSLPERPLMHAEVKQLSGAESIEHAIVIAEVAPPPRVVSVKLGVGGKQVLLGYGPDPSDPASQWSVIEQRPAKSD